MFSSQRNKTAPHRWRYISQFRNLKQIIQKKLLKQLCNKSIDSEYLTQSTLCPLGHFSCFFNFFEKNLSVVDLPSECQTDRIQIRLDVLSGLIWVQTVCKSYQQTILGGQELTLDASASIMIVLSGLRCIATSYFHRWVGVWCLSLGFTDYKDKDKEA